MQEYFELCKNYDTETMLKVSFLLIISIIAFYVFSASIGLLINIIVNLIEKRRSKKNG